MQFVTTEFVHVYRNTKETRTSGVDQNVFLTMNVPGIKLVFKINVWTRVPEHVGTMQFVKYIIIYPCVAAQKGWEEMHLLNVFQYYNVSMH